MENERKKQRGKWKKKMKEIKDKVEIDIKRNECNEWEESKELSHKREERKKTTTEETRMAGTMKNEENNKRNKESR